MAEPRAEPGPQRVYLRPVNRRDRDEFIAVMRRSASLHEPWIHPPITREAFSRYLKRLEQGDHVGLLVIEKETDAIVGCFNINNIVRGSFLSASLGYYAAQPYAGRGYMQEGLEQVITWAVEKLGLHRLEANIQPRNQRSIALVRRCGFKREGVSPDYLFIAGAWRDHERWTWLDRRHGLRPPS
ncbi:MAG: GNAT family protein [Gammaproteobacteria bacterium]|nr:GNAT family protein [Gammaproteobacteria bacterium]MDE0273138.1 GNAT family protein [Gammaproteobacteria bacterium]